MVPRPCIGCGRPIPTGSRCPTCRPRNGSTRQWRALRAQILDRDQCRCHVCGAPANTVDHLHPLSQGGGDDPANLAACCNPCNAKKRDGRR